MNMLVLNFSIHIFGDIGPAGVHGFAWSDQCSTTNDPGDNNVLNPGVEMMILLDHHDLELTMHADILNPTDCCDEEDLY